MRLIKLMTLALIASLTLASAPLVMAQDDKNADMLDKIWLNDGRVFTCQILEETDEYVKVEVHHLGLTTVQTWRKDVILDIKHRVVAPGEVKDAKADVGAAAKKDVPEGKGAGVYVVSLKGTVGLDSNKRIIERQWKAAVDRGAKIVVLEWDCEEMFPPVTADMEEYRDFFQDLKTEARDKEIQVIAWIKRASGIAIAYSLMFNDIYFQPNGKMGGGWEINEALTQMFQDEAVRAKMISAWVGILRGMAEEGGHSANLCEAMIRPELLLSVDRTGEHSTFRLDTNGATVLDSNSGSDPEQNTYNLDAEQALEFAVSKDTCRTLDDLMHSLRIREYHRVDDDTEELVQGWIDGWKAALDETRQIRLDMAEIDSYNEPADKKIAKKIAKLRDIQALIKKWPPLEVFIDPESIFFEIDTYKKLLRNIKEGQRGTMPGTGTGGGGGGKPGN